MSPRKATVAPPEGCACGKSTCAIPYGYCHCRCGGLTRIATITQSKSRRWAGRPCLYIMGHQTREIRPMLIQPSDSSVRLIALTCSQVTEVDARNYDRLMELCWHAWLNPDTNQYYARTNLKRSDVRSAILMHDFLMHPPDGLVVDHIDRNTLRNVESNLRVSTNAENCRNHKQFSTNKSGHTGVYWNLGKWRAHITFNSKSVYIGGFDRLEDAVAARVEKELELFGEHSRIYRDKEAV